MAAGQAAVSGTGRSEAPTPWTQKAGGGGKLRLGQRRAKKPDIDAGRFPIPAPGPLAGNRVPTYGRSSGFPITLAPP